MDNFNLKEYLGNNPLLEQTSEGLQVENITISFDINSVSPQIVSIGQVTQDITLAMGDTSDKVFELGEDIEKFSGLSQAEAEVYEETPTDAYIYGLVQPMNGGDNMYFFTNGTRLAGAAEELGAWPAIIEQLAHEGLHLTRMILTKHLSETDNWVEDEWPSVGEQENDILEEEAVTSALGLVLEQITEPYLAMAEAYIPELTEDVRTLK